MIINGTEANTLLAAQSASLQRQPAQDSAASEQRDRTLDTQRIGEQRAAEAPQTTSAVTAVEADDAGNAASARQDLPQDAQADARNAQENSQGGAVERGGAVDLFA